MVIQDSRDIRFNFSFSTAKIVGKGFTSRGFQLGRLLRINNHLCCSPDNETEIRAAEQHSIGLRSSKKWNILNEKLCCRTIKSKSIAGHEMEHNELIAECADKNLLCMF